MNKLNDTSSHSNLANIGGSYCDIKVKVFKIRQWKMNNLRAWHPPPGPARPRFNSISCATAGSHNLWYNCSTQRSSDNSKMLSDTFTNLREWHNDGMQKRYLFLLFPLLKWDGSYQMRLVITLRPLFFLAVEYMTSPTAQSAILLCWGWREPIFVKCTSKYYVS